MPITCDDKVIKEFFRSGVDRYLEKGVPLYITNGGLAYDICGRLGNFLNRNYSVELVGCKINEDWHHSCLGLLLFKDCLVRIKKKGP